MSEQLKPCPFCGSPKTEAQSDDGLFWIKCLGCYSTGPATTKYSGAEDNFYRDWNARAADAALAAKDAEIARLKDGVKMLEESCRAQSEELRTRDAEVFNLQYDANCASMKIRQLERIVAQPARQVGDSNRLAQLEAAVREFAGFFSSDDPRHWQLHRLADNAQEEGSHE